MFAWGLVAIVLGAIMAPSGRTAPGSVPPQVVTYHYDNYRTGWNHSEATLTPSNVGSLTLRHAVQLDERVDAQPLYMNGIVYVVTENNTVYAIELVDRVGHHEPKPWDTGPTIGLAREMR